MALTKIIFTIFIITLLFTTKSFSQSFYSIEGKVTDAKTNEPLAVVSVYLSQTTIGTLTDKNGNYKINKVSPGKYTLVISQIGYEPFLQIIEIKPETNTQRNFLLKSKPIEMHAIDIVEQSDEYAAYLKEQKDYREIFKKYFLGLTDFSKECAIENIEDIVFTKRNDLYIEAKCSKPIMVINKALGFKIECELIHFQYNEQKEGSIFYEFYPKFSDLDPENDNQIKQWEQNRKSAYQSSLRRFLLAVINSGTYVNGYILEISRGNLVYNKIESGTYFKKTNIVQYDSTSGLNYLKFDGYLMIRNSTTEEQSEIFLPYRTAYIGSDGYPVDTMSVLVFDTFARQGVANLLPIDLQMTE
ncbi:MAG: carboxypeptidase-like regulatory domain-containing protein [Ignavibacteriales bacterium]|nr:carboxypeptidase-like regulatory domain-containing protein [Ignavibacteriales bacterium]